MRRSRAASGISTPLGAHQNCSNSNDSCSQLTTNATSYMTNTINSHFFNLNQNSNHNGACSSPQANNTVAAQINQSEMRVRTLLKDLQALVNKSQEARMSSEPNLGQIAKSHEKMKKEEKMSISSRKKLRSLYATTLQDSEAEIKALRQVLDCISQVRLTQKEIRLLQTKQLNSSLTSPTTTTHLADTSTDSKSVIVHKKGPTVTMRRGVLMSILQQAALTLPLWIGDIGQSPPALCGSIPPQTNYICKPGDKVAAIVKNSSGGASADDGAGGGEEDENWILAEVVAYHPSTGKYDVDDVDAEEDQIRYTLSRKRVVPLPLWRANPLTDPDAIFPKDSFVLALYPQTTCFYRGIVSEAPQTPLEDYLILFEDNTYPEGYSPPLNVPQLYVVDCQQEFKK